MFGKVELTSINQAHSGLTNVCNRYLNKVKRLDDRRARTHFFYHAKELNIE